jgi:hypothetical protein
MKRGMLLSLAAAVVAAVVTGGCGSESPSGASAAGGVVVQGVVLGDGASSMAAADTQAPAWAQAKKVTVKVDGTSLTVDVSTNGTFRLTGVPSGSFTLVFLADGVEIGRVVVTADDGSEVKIVVQVTDSVLVVVELKVESPEPKDATTGSSCVVNGGKANEGIELEGKVASGTWQSFHLTATGRSSEDIVVNGAGATFTCIGSAKKTTDAECKASVADGARVHVRGTLTSCTTAPAQVTAQEVKVQKG